MSTSSIILPESFNANAIRFSDTKVLSNGGKSVYVNYDGNYLVMQTPKMLCPYGISKYDEPGKEPKFNLDMSFGQMDDNPGCKSLFNMLKTFDEKLVVDASQNSLSWFKRKSTSVETLRELYTPMIKVARDKETLEPSDRYPPTFKVKLPYRDGKFLCDVYSAKREKLENPNLEDLLNKGCRVQVIVQCMGLWFAGGKYGCSWKVIQMKIDESKSRIKEYAFLDDDDAEDTEGDNLNEDDVVQEDSDNEP